MITEAESDRGAQFERDVAIMKNALQEHAEGKSRPVEDYFNELHAKLFAMNA